MNSNSYRNMLSNHDNMFQAVPAGPFEKMAWSGDNSLGNVVDFAPDANNRQIILKLDEWGPPVMWTISLGIDRHVVPNNVGVTGWFDIKAEIYFGVGGSTQLVEVDWVAGQCLSVPMNAVSVTAVYDLAPGTDIRMLDNLRLSVQIARGTNSSKYPPTRTLYFPQADTVLGDPAGRTYGINVQRLPPFTREVQIIRPASYIDPFAAYNTNPPPVGQTAGLLFGDVPVSGPLGIYAPPKQITRTILSRDLSLPPIPLADQQRFNIPKGSRLVGSWIQKAVGDSWNAGEFWLNCYLGL